MALPFELDGGAAEPMGFGLIVLQTDETLETELTPLFARAGLTLYHTRLPSAPDVTPETLKQMKAELPNAIALLPRAARLDTVAYACTSGATLIGSGMIAELIQNQYPLAQTTDPMTAVIAALRHLHLSRIAVITPYIPSVTNQMRTHMEAQGFQIAALGSFEQIEETTVARITEQSLLKAVEDIGRLDDVDAVFASCTNLRSFSIIDQAEKLTGKPFISSNLAMAWHMLTLAGLPTRNRLPGQLFASEP